MADMGTDLAIDTKSGRAEPRVNGKPKRTRIGIALGAGAARGWETLATPDPAELAGRSLAMHAPAWRDALPPPQE